MNELTKTNHATLGGFHTRAKEILANLYNPTPESVEYALKEIKSYSADAIVPFTGYYSMDVANGAFLSIDTVETYYKVSQNNTIKFTSVTVTVSMDGVNSQTYPLDQSTIFDGYTLTIPNILTITLTRQYNNGVLTTFYGTIYNVNVTGFTRFNPITLPTFNGRFYAATPSLKEVLSVTSLPAPFDSTIEFDFGYGLREITLYTFNPLMFVLMFDNPDTGEGYVLMLGTAGSKGLACFIQHGASGEYAVTIPNG